MNNGATQMQRFEITVWEKAEHWTFETQIEAKDERDAWQKAMKEYPKRSYSIRNVHPLPD